MRLKRHMPLWAAKRKSVKFVTAPRGAHRLDESLPLLSVVRDRLNLGDDAREARRIITSAQVFVDGKVCRDSKRGVGLFDVVSIPSIDVHKRVVFAGIPKLVDVPKKESNLKMCKITSKKAVRGGKIQLGLHDGRTIVVPAPESKKYKTLDSIMLELPNQAIKGHVAFDIGSLALVISSKRKRVIGRIKKIERGFRKKVFLESDGEVFEARLKSVFVVGRDKALVGLGDENEL